MDMFDESLANDQMSQLSAGDELTEKEQKEFIESTMFDDFSGNQKGIISSNLLTEHIQLHLYSSALHVVRLLCFHMTARQSSCPMTMNTVISSTIRTQWTSRCPMTLMSWLTHVSFLDAFICGML